MTAKPRGIKLLKITGLVLGILLALLLGFHFWFQAHARGMLEDLVATRSNGKVKLKLEKLRFSYFSNKMELENADFYNTDTVNENTAYRFTVKRIRLEVKALWPVLFKNQFLIDSLTLYEPDIRVTRLRTAAKIDRPRDEEVSIPGEMGKVYNSIRDALKVLKVTRFRIEEGKFTLVNRIQADALPMTISHLNFRIDNFLVDTGTLDPASKILFSDNIELRSRHQDIIFPDGRHRLSFRNFSINLRDKLVRFDSCTIAASRGDSSNASFNVYMDALMLTNIDFDTLYRSELIKADSVYCVNPRFTLDVELGKKREGGKPPPKLEDIVKQLTGNLELAHVVVSNADFNIRTVRDGIPNSFTFTQNNFEMEGLHIDQDAPKSIQVKSFVMAIRNYENFIRDSSYSIQFDSIMLKDDRITLSNFVFNKLNNGRIVNTFSIPQFNLQGLSWDDLVFEKRLKAEQAIMFSPNIRYTISNPGKKRENIFQMLGAVSEYMDLQYLDVIDGKIHLQVHDDLQIQLDSATLAIQSHSLLTSTKLSGIKNSLTRLFFKRGMIRAGNLVISLGGIRYIGNTGQFEAGTISVTDDAKNLSIVLQNAAVEQMLVNEVAGNIYASGVTWQQGELKINQSATPVTKPVSIELHQVRGSNTSLAASFGETNVSSDVKHISFSELVKKPGEKLSISGLEMDGKDLVLRDGVQHLSISGYQLADRNPSIFNDLAYTRKDSNMEADIKVPLVRVTPQIAALLDDHIMLDRVVLENPRIRLQLRNSKQGIFNAGKIPILDISDMTLLQPGILFTQVKDSGEVKLSWNGYKDPSSYLRFQDLHIDKSAILNASLKQVGFYLSGFSYTGTNGKSFSTGKGSIDALFRNMEIQQENDLPAEWKGIITTLDAKELELDSIGKQNGRLTLPRAIVEELQISTTKVINFQRLVSGNPAFHLKQVTGAYADARSHIQWHNAAFARSTNLLTLDSFSFLPVLSREAFMATQAYQVDYVTARTGAIRMGPVDAELYATEKKLNIGSITINDAVITDYRDKRLPVKENIVKRLPGAMIRKIPFDLAVDTVVLNNTHIEYTEINPATNSTAIVPVTKLNAKIFPVRNYGFAVTDSLAIHAEGKLLDTLSIRLRVKESYTDSLHGFRMTVRLRPMDLRALNPVMIPATKIKITSGFLDTLSMRVTGRDALAFGEMDMKYHDLKIKVLKEGNEDKRSSGLLNFIVNSFVVRNKNTSRKGTVFYLRDRERSALNYLVRIAMSGIISSVGAKSNKKQLKEHQPEVAEKPLPGDDLD